MEVKHRRGKENVVPDALSRSIEVLEVDDGNKWYRNLFEAVETDPEKYIDFRIENGELFKFVSAQSDVLDYRFEWKQCVPESSRERIMQQEHDGNLHIGFEKCIEKLLLAANECGPEKIHWSVCFV